MRITAAILLGLIVACMGAAPATRPAVVTLRMKDVAPQAVIDEFNRQSRLRLRAMDAESLPPKVSIEVAGLPPLLALREVCAALHVWPSASGEPDTLALEPDETSLKKPFAISGPLMVVIDSIDHSRSVHASGREPTSTFEMYLTALIDPSVRVLAHHPGVKVTEAVDERGNSLVLKRPAEEAAAEADDVDMDWSAASILQIDLTAGLAYPAKDAGRRIARLKGSVGAYVLERSERLEVVEPMKVKDTARSAAGVRYVVNAVGRKAESYHVQLTMHRETAGEEQWQRLQNLAHPAVLRLLDDKGNALAFEGVQEHDNGSRRCQITLAYAAQDPVTERPVAPPAKLVWDLPVVVKAAELPFELRDVPMP